jgi:hypothetical protein
MEGETQNSHPSSTDLKNVWRYTSTPPTFFRGVHMHYEVGDTREQVTVQLNLPSVEPKSVLGHCYHDKQKKRGGSGYQTEWVGEQNGVGAECVDLGGSSPSVRLSIFYTPYRHAQ